MGLQQTPPGGGSAKRRTHWAHVNVRAKERWDAYTAGFPHWFTCHDVFKKTKPCLHVVTQGEMTCPYCARMLPTYVAGYVPLYRAMDSKPCHVRVYDDARADLDQLRLHTRVMVGRGPLPGDCVYVMKYSVQEPLFKTADPDKLTAVNLTESLLRMWSIPELIGWYNLTEQRAVPAPKDKPAVSDTPMSLLPKIANGEHGTIGDWVEVALGNVKDRNEKFVEAIKKGEAAARRNGKAKPTE
jgi:hypothetical protein